MRNLIGQSLFIGVSGLTLTPEEKTFIAKNNIGGVTLFGRNLQSPEQVRDLCAEIQSLHQQQADRAPLFIGIDMEGGRVHRLKKPFTQWPPAARLGEIDNATVSFHFAMRMGQELKAVGINLNYAPCLDILTNPTNPAIGDRAISSNPAIVEKHASGLVRGFIKSEIVSCAKHFPGHGNTIVDSHFELPVESADRERLDKIELVPFRKAFRSRVDMVMTSHILFEKLDPEWPVSLSHRVITGMIRDEFRFRGVIITDDLGMHALTKKWTTEEIAVRGLEAGNDVLLYCNDFEAPEKALAALDKALVDKKLSQDHLMKSREKILALKKDRLIHVDPLPKEMLAQFVGTADNQRIADAIAKGETPSGLTES